MSCLKPVVELPNCLAPDDDFPAAASYFFLYLGLVHAVRVRYESILRFRLPNYHNSLRVNGLLTEYTVNAPAFFNAVASSGYAVYSLVTGTWNPPLFTLAYFFYDALVTPNYALFLHHAVGIALLSLSCSAPAPLAALVLMTEVSTIFLCVRQMIKGHPKLPRTRLNQFEVRDIAQQTKLLRISYVYFRLIQLPGAVYAYQTCIRPLELWTLNLLFLLNVFWIGRRIVSKN